MITAIDKNTALVLIDLQNGITQMDTAHPIKNVLEKSALLVSAFRKAKFPVVVVNVNPVKRNITGIVLAGVATSIGVEGIARAASELGYNISFPSDAMTDRVLEAHENSFRHIFQNMGEQGTTADIITKLSSRS